MEMQTTHIRDNKNITFSLGDFFTLLTSVLPQGENSMILGTRGGRV